MTRVSDFDQMTFPLEKVMGNHHLAHDVVIRHPFYVESSRNRWRTYSGRQNAACELLYFHLRFFMILYEYCVYEWSSGIIVFGTLISAMGLSARHYRY